MKGLRKYKILSSLLLFLLLFFCLPLLRADVFANVIKQIEIEATIQEDGSIIIKDRRVLEASRGTEHYISLGILGSSELLSFSVYEGDMAFENIGQWDSSKSIEEKKAKCGVIREKDSLELCFGIGSLGSHDFTMVYHFSNAVRNLKDGKQALYWEFIQPNNLSEIQSIQVRVKNTAGFSYTEDNTRMWGFGYRGGTKITEKALEMWTEGIINKEHYVVLLAIFPENTFAASASSDYSSDGIIEKAKKGSIWGPKKSSEKSILSLWYIWGIPLVIFLLLVGHAVFRGKRRRFIKQEMMPTVGEGEYYRRIPYEGEILSAVSLLSIKHEDLINALILKWIRKGYIKTVDYRGGRLIKKTRTGLAFNDQVLFAEDSQAEKNLWQMIKLASGEDCILEQNEFRNFLKVNFKNFDQWKDDTYAFSQKHMLKEKLFSEMTYQFLFWKDKVHIPSEEGKAVINRVEAFKNYLLDFSILDEREAYNVFIWDDYMIWAALLGIADKVRAQFNLVYPDYSEQSSFDDDNYDTASGFSHYLVNTVDHLLAKEARRSEDGGGGSSSVGGGSGATGSSSGGGIR